LDYREYQHSVRDAIERRANCTVAYYQTQPVRIALDGEILWKGKVEVFKLQGHPQASLAFGWGFENAQKKMEYVTVMGVPPLDNPISAVKAFLASRRLKIDPPVT
jgi:hypothetical protein